MNAIFHRAKHWQLFILTSGVLLVILFIGIFDTSWMDNPRSASTRADVLTINIIIECLQFFVDLVLFGWFWSIAIGLKKYLPPNIGMNYSLFNVFFFLSLAYSFYDFYGALEYELFWDQFKNGGAPREMRGYISWFSNLNPLVLMITLFVTFCNLYLFFFCAKMLHSIEHKRSSDFSDYVGYFFLTWFHFIGLWIMQPKINELTSKEISLDDPLDLDEGTQTHNLPKTKTSESFSTQPKNIPSGDQLNTKDNPAFDHDDDFEGLF